MEEVEGVESRRKKNPCLMGLAWATLFSDPDPQM